MPDMRGKGLPGIKTQPWTLAHPTQLTFVVGAQNYPTGPIVQLSRTPRQARYATTDFRGPVVVTAAVSQSFPTGAQIQLVRLARQARWTRSRFRPPVVVGAAVTALPYPLRVTLAHPNRPVKLGTVIRKPAVVGPAYLPLRSRVTLAKPGAFRPPARYKVKPPTIVGAAQTGPFPVGLQITLARTRPEYRPLLGLTWVAAPAIVNPALGPLPLRVTLAPPLPRALRRTRSTLRPPTAVLPATATGFPTGPIVQLVRTPRQARRVTYTQRRPAVVATPTLTRAQLTLRVTLAHRQWGVQPTHSKYPGPTVVSPFVPPPPVVVQHQQDMTPFIVHGF